GSMHKHIHALIDAGLVEPFNGQKRGIKLKNTAFHTHSDAVFLPFLGKIAAGNPLEAIENPEMLEIPSSLYNGKECFMLQVNGDSMIEAGIHDGDTVIIEKTSQVRNGDIVVALIDNYEATLKTFEKTDDLIILQPENHNMKPMIFQPYRVTIQGKLIAQMRKYF
ncbi:MAG: transcriptional repressor LexA, partial [Gammaproteobacteria bacterium]|nr:transcriptional repressor LexA [Gammaproteobacteria bacterium]